MEKRCQECGAAIKLLRSDAAFCSGRCRASNARNHGIPREMRRLRRWVRYDAQKRPLRVSTGRCASSTDEGTWSSFREAVASTHGEGLGFVLGGGIGCIDLDHCFEGGELASWARKIVDANQGALLVEVSRSGEGLHLFVWMGEGKGEVTRDGRNIEVYPPNSGRFIATTGNRYFR